MHFSADRRRSESTRRQRSLDEHESGYNSGRKYNFEKSGNFNIENNGSFVELFGCQNGWRTATLTANLYLFLNETNFSIYVGIFLQIKMKKTPLDILSGNDIDGHFVDRLRLLAMFQHLTDLPLQLLSFSMLTRFRHLELCGPSLSLSTCLKN